jgi:hypothetical protein
VMAASEPDFQLPRGRRFAQSVLTIKESIFREGKELPGCAVPVRRPRWASEVVLAYGPSDCARALHKGYSRYAPVRAAHGPGRICGVHSEV